MKFLFLLSSLTLPQPRALIQPAVAPAVIKPNPDGSGTYPRLAQLADGSVLGTTTVFQGDTHVLSVSRSTDGGQTFSALGTVASGTGDLDNLYTAQLANGDVLATFRNHDKDASGAYTFYRLTASISHDNGQTWTFLSQIDQRAAQGVNGLWEPFIRIAKSGAIQVYYAAENAADDQDILMRSSTDNGATWSAATTVAGATTTGRDGMPGCTDLTTQTGAAQVLCVFETTEGTAPLFSVKSVVSDDDGATFSGRTQVFLPTGAGKNAGAPQVATSAQGTLVVSFMTDEDNSAAHTWPDGAAFKIQTAPSASPAVWGQKATVLSQVSFWPSLFSKTDGSNTVVGCADNAGAKCHALALS
ncbi:glycoside hydrolase family 93 protein [Mycena metata]|uniref:Glycoside hydrolase family 93 protein n=1 Tax=Mycena metata TaxID=1033252 RepID=A0AAD7J6Q0_9AGAR|nr:glycoside hydrolase family 93 protein [Mycena metata]